MSLQRQRVLEREGEIEKDRARERENIHQTR